VSTPGTLAWFARHELRLAWRDFHAMLTAGGRRRTRGIAVALVVFAAFIHLVAYRVIGDSAHIDGEPGKVILTAVTVAALLAWSMMLSQALESVTRAFYARADLDLILSSPTDARKIFAVRIAALAVAAVVTALAIAAPFINVLVLTGGARWLAGYAVAVAMGAAATACATTIAAALFRTLGPQRTRLAAQVTAAIVGAAFVIGLQAGAIFSFGTISQFALTRSAEFVRHTPGPQSPLWWLARAILGEPRPLVLVLIASFALLGLAILIFAPRFADTARAAANVAAPARRQRHAAAFRHSSRTRALRQKEWTLLRRDPWLASQTLMQLLYLLPPALLLWRSFGDRQGTLLLLVPVLVMAAGQLAGGLAWLAVSGEDAPDLIATAPVLARQIIRTKIEAVIGAVALVFAPFVIVFAALSFRQAAVTIAGILVAAATATTIQLWFRAQAKRSHFRRRQTSSRLATFSEAFSSIGWAATAGLAASGTWLALAPALLTTGVISGAYYLRPRQA
jgi:ABC-2 type transport system permease protein